MALDIEIQERLEQVRGRISRAAAAAGRNPADVSLVAVSKTFGAEHVAAAAAAGQVEFGENRVQEAAQKIPALASLPIRWHLVGHLQSNKVRKAAALFHCVHSIDSPEILLKLDEAAAAVGRTIEALVQVDLAGEQTKHGAVPETLDAIFSAAAACLRVAVTGLMVLPPFFEDPEQARPFFRRLAALRDTLSRRDVPDARLRHLSMGMSHDFEVAIQEGATMVRVGTAIFGARP